MFRLGCEDVRLRIFIAKGCFCRMIKVFSTRKLKASIPTLFCFW